MLKTTFLWLIWQNSETRQRYHVGNLQYKNERFSFSYDHSGKHRGLYEALVNGYRPHLAFPDVNLTYASSFLFPSFKRRLPDPGRPDFQALLKKFGLTRNCSEMDMLYVTGGRLATDSYELVLPILIHENKLVLNFYVAGIRHYIKRDMLILNISDLHLVREPANTHDPFAVRIETQSSQLLGYVPAFYSEFISNMLEKQITYTLNVLDVDEQAIPQLSIRVSLQAPVNNVSLSLSKSTSENLSPLSI